MQTQAMIRITTWAMILTLVPIFTAGSAVADRDQRRLENAQQVHQREVERAYQQYMTQIDRANATLERQYESVIRSYDQRDDTAAAQKLRDELEQLVAASLEPPEQPDRGHEQLIRAVGPSLVNADRRAYSSEDRLAERDLVLLYFSASWCGPCRQFTPQLNELYQQAARQGNFEIVHVSSDRSEPAMYDYMRDANMTYSALPFNRAEAFRQQYEVRGIPHVIALDQQGEIVARGQANVLQAVRDRIRRTN